MSTPKRGPTKIDLTGPHVKRKLNVEWNPLAQKYVVTVGSGLTYLWSATQFAAYFRKWLLRQRELSNPALETLRKESEPREFGSATARKLREKSETQNRE